MRNSGQTRPLSFPYGGLSIVSESILKLHCSATRGLLARDHVILNHGQVTWTTSELAPHSPHHTNRRTFQLSTDLTCIAALHGGSLAVLGSMPAMIRYLDHWATAVPFRF
ncbi:hypothetical protein TNCV_831171 [Trichonephila clavipes]|nr:hypothetical protein TNCV_831171 [Trichonephila clavipes]